MALNKQKGNMYPFVTHTWNVIKGKCPHDCIYCYMKRGERPQPELHFDEKELKTDLGSGNFIFVGSSCDMWAALIPFEWLVLVVRNCYAYRKNKYLFQTKNPARFQEFEYPSDMDIVLGVTIETNRHYEDITKAPSTWKRYADFIQLDMPKMVSIEPIMDFDLPELVRWIKDIKPEFVSIGADSKGHNLPEPAPDKVERLIAELQQFTKVIVKDNLKRIITQNIALYPRLKKG